MCIRDSGSWHHVGPFQAANHDQAFATVFAPENGVDLAGVYGDAKLKWTEQPGWKDSVAHNDKLTGNNCASYLYRVIESETAQPVALNLGSDDGIKVWVNGREVLAKKVGRNTAAAGQEKAAALSAMLEQDTDMCAPANNVGHSGGSIPFGNTEAMSSFLASGGF